ncbi:MAG: hypothetical protein WBH56_11030 [Bacteroidota bacterium]
MMDIIGWVGAVAVLVAYFLVSAGRVTGNSVFYQSLNILGGACLILNTVYYGAYPSSGVNVVWVGIALYSLSRRNTRRPAD